MYGDLDVMLLKLSTSAKLCRGTISRIANQQLPLRNQKLGDRSASRKVAETNYKFSGGRRPEQLKVKIFATSIARMWPKDGTWYHQHC